MRTHFVALLACTALLPIAAAAQEYPKLKAGLWELNRSSDRAPDKGMHTTICLDESVQKEMWDMGLGAMKEMCSKNEFRISGSKGSGESICSIGGSTMHSKYSMTLTGDTGYRTEVDTTFDPPLNGQAKDHSTLEARYTGACKAGQRPGDMTLPGGQTFNMRNAVGGRPPGAPVTGRPPGDPASGRPPGAPK